MLENVFRKPTSETSLGEAAPRPKRSGPLGPAFLVPLLFLALAGCIIFFFGFLSFDATSPRELLDEIRTSTGERRALAAFELSRLQRLDFPEGGEPAFVTEALRTFEEEKDRDPRIRRALALVLGRTGDPRAVPGLVGALADSDVETQIYSIWALGALGDTSAAGSIDSKLQHEDPAIRKMAAFSLGQIGNPDSIPALRIALQDSVPDVTWNAAVALARMGDRSGLPVLLPLLLSRGAPGGLTVQQGEDLKINIIRSFRRLGGAEVAQALGKAAEVDPSARVRGEARRPRKGDDDRSAAPLPPVP
jgi:hypothetical protein